MKALSITKLLLAFMTVVSISASAYAGELERAYQKEYAFLKAQKVELEKRLATDTVKQAKDLNASKEKVEVLQAKLLDLSEQGKTSS